MNRTFLTDDGPASLAPFFSTKMTNLIMVSLLIVCAVLLLAWPRQPPHAYLTSSRTPPVFFLVSSAVLIVYGYLNLCSGRGEVIEYTRLAVRLHENVVTWEERCGYFSYTLPAALAQAGMLLVILAPPLSVAAALSGVDAAMIRRTFLIIAATGIFCRGIGFSLFLIWGRWHFLGWAAARLFFLGYIFGTALVSPRFSALRILYEPMAGSGPHNAGQGTHEIHLGFTVSAIIVLTLGNALLWRRNRQRRMARQQVRQEGLP